MVIIAASIGLVVGVVTGPLVRRKLSKRENVLSAILTGLSIGVLIAELAWG